jgi:hypothetical protein
VDPELALGQDHETTGRGSHDGECTEPALRAFWCNLTI